MHFEFWMRCAWNDEKKNNNNNTIHKQTHFIHEQLNAFHFEFKLTQHQAIYVN